MFLFHKKKNYLMFKPSSQARAFLEVEKEKKGE